MSGRKAHIKPHAESFSTWLAVRGRVLLLLAVGTLAFGQVIAPKQALERLFTVRPAQEDWFGPDFLKQVPVAMVNQIVASLEAQLGAYQGVRLEGQDFVVFFERGEVPTRIALDEQGRITTLFFRPPRQRLKDFNEAVNALRALPGKVSLLVLENGKELAALNPDEPLAVGSAFKLAVLAALKQEIEKGRLGWTSTAELKPEWKSLPSGILQDWPDGSPLTLHTLATLMISLSDNTAADVLIHTLGRERIEAVSPRNRPFLTTREAFILKDPDNEQWLQRYLQEDAEQRWALLAEIKNLSLPHATSFPPKPTALEVEWFFTVRELCDLIAEVGDLSLMGVNPGLAARENWARVAYKGGSEPGVLNLTTGLVSKSGKRYCVSATWNNPKKTLDAAHLYTIYGGILQLLRSY